MAELPGGTVTLLFTDIEGSTRLVERLEDRYPAVLADHDRLLPAAVEAHGGRAVSTQGDAFLVAFARAADAVAAAVEAQRALAEYPWPEGAAVRVRMGLHTGEPTLAGGDYTGLDVHRAARLCAAGHGGQVLLSEATRALVGQVLPGGIGLRDLGEHRLKDLQRPERVCQLVVAGLPADFPPLRTLDTRPHNLPVQPTALIGRERDVGAARAELLRPEVHLLTLTGPGGAGKTRLGLQLAAEVIDHFEDGVFFVALAPISDPRLVAPTVAQTLGIRDAGGRPLLESLEDYLRGRQLLLVLDNFEQLLAAGPLVADLLAVSPGLKILVTSRAALHLRGEHEFPVPPLALPDPKRPPPAGSLSQYGAAALFIERAAAVRPDFAVTDENAPAVAQICARLDGLPLAIELAAARMRVLPPQAMLARLDRRLSLLTGGARDLPARQQTLRDTIAWSHDLLDAGEQALFRRLSVFVGGCTLEVAEVVCSSDDGSEIDLLDGLTSLAAKSLLRQEEQGGGEPRFLMLETIREYGLEQLEASGETAALRRRHAGLFLGLAEEAAPMLRSAEQLAWFDRLEVEHDNLRAALAWTRADGSATDMGLRLAGKLWWFWHHRSRVGEGRGWLEGALASAGVQERTAARAEALIGAGLLANVQGDYVAARGRLEEALALGRELGDRRAVAYALCFLGIRATWHENDHATAGALQAESAAIFRDVGDTWGLATAVGQLGIVARLRGDYATARALGEESAALFQETGDRFGIGLALMVLGQTALREGDPARAAAHFTAALQPLREFGISHLLPRCLLGLVSTARAQGDHERAARLFGAAEALRETVGAPVIAVDRADYDRNLATLRSSLDEDTFARAWAEGRAMSPEQAIEYALAAPEPAGPAAALPRTPSAASRAAPLTRREQEIAALIARGLTNRQIAAELVIAHGTAERHVANILSKLGLESRAQVAVWAVEHGLLAGRAG